MVALCQQEGKQCSWAPPPPTQLPPAPPHPLANGARLQKSVPALTSSSLVAASTSRSRTSLCLSSDGHCPILCSNALGKDALQLSVGLWSLWANQLSKVHRLISSSRAGASLGPTNTQQDSKLCGKTVAGWRRGNSPRKCCLCRQEMSYLVLSQKPSHPPRMRIFTQVVYWGGDPRKYQHRDGK